MEAPRTTDLLLETDADFLRKTDQISTELAHLEKVNRASRRSLADKILQKHHAYLPALPSLFVEAVALGSKWHADLDSLKAVHEPLVSAHESLVIHSERLQTRLDKTKEELATVNREKREAVEMAVGFERQKMSMLHKKMESDQEILSERAEACEGDMYLFKAEMTEAMELTAKRDDEIVELEMQVDDLSEAKASLTLTILNLNPNTEPDSDLLDKRWTASRLRMRW